jgi:putative ABC transport system ATP-binding protein
MEPKLLRYIWRHSKGEQLWMLIVILLSMPTYFLSLDLPKRIVNGPIQGTGFENPDDTAHFLTVYLPLPDWITGGSIQLFEGFEFDRVESLFALSLTFLALVAANGLFKLYINTYKGRMGERILRRLRYELVDRVLRYPLSRFRRTKPSEIASMIKDEVEPMGEFIGDAFTQPLFLGGQALTGLAFIMIQNVYLGLVTLVVVIFQAWLVPRLRRRLLVLGRQRQIEARKLAGRIGEVVEGIKDTHTNDTTNYERSIVSGTLGRLFFIRFELYQRKFSVKFINNMLIQFLAFIFYAAGGYLAIRGTLDIGQLVAVIAAYKDLPDPIRGLIDYDQRRLSVDVRYNQIIEQFSGDDIQPVSTQLPAEKPVEPLKTGYDIYNLQLIDDTGSKLIEKASAKIGVGETVAIIGSVNSGATHFTEAVARLWWLRTGRLDLDGHPINELPEHVTGQRLAYIDGDTYLPQSTIYEALTYVLKNKPVAPANPAEDEKQFHESMLEEAERAGNSELDPDAYWIDYQRIGLSGPAELETQIRKILADVDIENDIRNFGLRGTLDVKRYPELREHLIEARHKFRDKLDTLGFTDFVEPFDPDKYNNQATIGENILFGTANIESYDPSNFPSNETVRKVLRDAGLETTLFEMGKQIAATTVELFSDLSEDNPFFDQLTYMDPEMLPEYRAALNRSGNDPLEKLSTTDQDLFLRLPFAYTEARNRLGLLTDDLKSDIVKVRHQLRKVLEDSDEHAVNFFDPDRYNPAASVLDNVLLGRIASGVAEGPERVTNAIRELLDEMNLTDDIFHIGLDYNIGTGGKRLSETQRQKIHLARALLKQPDFLIVNQALNSLDTKTQQTIMETVIARAKGRDGQTFGLIWSPMNPAYAQMFDRVLIFKQGNLIADGTPKDLLESSAEFAELTGG